MKAAVWTWWIGTWSAMFQPRWSNVATHTPHWRRPLLRPGRTMEPRLIFCEVFLFFMLAVFSYLRCTLEDEEHFELGTWAEQVGAAHRWYSRCCTWRRSGAIELRDQEEEAWSSRWFGEDQAADLGLGMDLVGRGPITGGTFWSSLLLGLLWNTILLIHPGYVWSYTVPYALQSETFPAPHQQIKNQGQLSSMELGPV